MAFLSHLRPNNKSKKPITKRKTFRGIKVTKATPRVATITASVATAANAPTIALRQLLVIRATRTRVNASTNSTAEARNAAITIAHCICFFLLFSVKFGSRVYAKRISSDRQAPLWHRNLEDGQVIVRIGPHKLCRFLGTVVKYHLDRACSAHHM